MSNFNKTIEDEEEGIKVQPFYHYETSVIHKVQHFYISSPIGEPSKYTDMLNIIRCAAPTDTIVLHLNTPGGQLQTGVQIISALNSTQAHVVACLEGEVCSLGTLIFLAADEFVVHDNCLIMIHNYSGGTYGKGHEQAAQLEAVSKWFSSLAKDLYIPFLSTKEFERMEKGEDIWMGSDEIRKRLENMVKTLEKKQKKSPPKKKVKKTK